VTKVTDQALSAAFDASRQRLHAIAFRMLGSRVEADDAVQDTWLRLSSADHERIDNLGGWLTTVVARVCLDRLKSRPFRSEEPVGAGTHDTPATTAPAVDGDPADELVMAESIVGRSPAAARQLASRARRRVQSMSTPTQVDLVLQREVVDAFLRATRSGDFQALVQILDPTVVLRPDAAAEKMGAFRATEGASQVASILAGGAQAAQRAIVNGLAGLVWAPGGHIRGVIQFTIRDGRITALDVTSDPGRIDAFDIALLDT
jgi:DNA-directed RNA polymerase specialized sigma24 family protein